MKKMTCNVSDSERKIRKLDWTIAYYLREIENHSKKIKFHKFDIKAEQAQMKDRIRLQKVLSRDIVKMKSQIARLRAKS